MANGQHQVAPAPIEPGRRSGGGKGCWIALAVATQSQFERLRAVLGRPNLCGFGGRARGVAQNEALMDGRIQEYHRQRIADEIEAKVGNFLQNPTRDALGTIDDGTYFELLDFHHGRLADVAERIRGMRGRE